MKHFLLTFLALSGLSLSAQKSLQSTPAWLIQPSIAYLSSAGDMEYRFGKHLSVGLGAGYKTSENWTYSLDVQYSFGTQVKNIGSLLNTMLTENGNILNETGNYGQVDLNQRGLSASFDVSKTFNWLAVNPNSGINLLFGAGYLSHWINYNLPGQDVPQLMDEYKKGYDELSGGLMLKQSIGYTYMSSNRRINFRLSFEIMEAFTTNYRKFSYSTGREVSGKMNDLIYGFRFQWMLPIYGTSTNDPYYYD